jgi:SAM-dependent methyltransferase
MAQYQTFPDAAGDSRTLEKLKSLKLPDLAGRSFLDVGCNEGFFCGFARFLGASRAVGLDHSQLFVERARQRFPDCEFHQQGWDRLPEGRFDVVLLASALHYADDQAGLLHNLVELLTPDGVLVLELGIVSSQDSEWIEVERGIDSRRFPTMPKLREVLQDYAWKWMGRSVSQDGDPVTRHVVHVSRRRPAAYLLMLPPAYGKTSIASGLFGRAGVRVVSGDEKIALAARGSGNASDRLREAIRRDYSPFRLDETIQRIFDSGLGRDLVEMWLEPEEGRGDVALDAYVPAAHHAQVEAAAAELGYLPVRMQWDRVGPRLLPAETIEDRAEAFYAAMAAPASPRPKREESELAPGKAKGFVDEIAFGDGRFTLRGWAVTSTGSLPARLGVLINGRKLLIDDIAPRSRPDVQRHLQLPHAMVGYEATFEMPGIAGPDDVEPGFGVFVPGMGGLRLAGRVAELLSGNRGKVGAR